MCTELWIIICEIWFVCLATGHYLTLRLWIRSLNSAYFIFFICRIVMIFYIPLQSFQGKSTLIIYEKMPKKVLCNAQIFVITQTLSCTQSIVLYLIEKLLRQTKSSGLLKLHLVTTHSSVMIPQRPKNSLQIFWILLMLSNSGL